MLKGGVDAKLGGEGLRPTARYARHKQQTISALQTMVAAIEHDQWDRTIELATIIINHSAELLMIPDEA